MMTEAELVTEMKKNDNYRKLVAYGQVAGIGDDTLLDPAVSIFAYLAELSYGHQPQQLDYIESVSAIDSAQIRNAAWRLAAGDSIGPILVSIEPKAKAYHQLKYHYSRLLMEGKSDSARAVRQSMNIYRWINRQTRGSDHYVVVNIRGGYLRGFDATGKEEISMNVIAGKSSTPTPTMYTYASGFITYPYWYVPKSIAVGEILPRIRRDIGYLERNSFEVINSRGRLIDAAQVDWHSVSESDFGYTFRQATGEKNSLGLLKVNIKNPDAIFLHDTNVRSLFSNRNRWRSHGCVRLQKPAKLANFLAGENVLEDGFLKNEIKQAEEERKPNMHDLKKKVPVFILYMPADVDARGSLYYFEDVYELDAPVS